MALASTSYRYRYSAECTTAGLCSHATHTAHKIFAGLGSSKTLMWMGFLRFWELVREGSNLWSAPRLISSLAIWIVGYDLALFIREDNWMDCRGAEWDGVSSWPTWRFPWKVRTIYLCHITLCKHLNMLQYFGRLLTGYKYSRLNMADMKSWLLLVILVAGKQCWPRPQIWKDYS